MTSPLVDIQDVSVDYRSGRRQHVRAVDGVSLQIEAGKVFGLLGESGSGKSTLARAIVGLVPLSSGQILIDGVDWSGLPRRELQRHRQKIQFVFQNPYSSLNPSHRIWSIVAEPLRVRGVGRAERRERAVAALERVGLEGDTAGRYARQFSGGQRQRIAIARAIIGEPKVIVCDEAVSALDVSTQAGILNLLLDLVDDMDLSLLFISHDVPVVEHVADEIAVMKDGQVVDQALAHELRRTAESRFTRALLEAVPSLSVRQDT
jgi:ABC-type glutathione transport system ATPase component